MDGESAPSGDGSAAGDCESDAGGDSGSGAEPDGGADSDSGAGSDGGRDPDAGAGSNAGAGPDGSTGDTTAPPPAIEAATPDDPAQVVVSWSGGKDAAWMHHRLGERDDVRVVALLTTGSTETGRTSMHGVRRALMERQAAALDRPLGYVELPHRPSNDEYERRMAAVLADYADSGVDAVAFADLYLEDVREYRAARMADATLDGWWPVWGSDTRDLAGAFVDAGFEATLVCVDDDLGPGFAGRRFDRDLLADLPDEVDPCGENGEFHTFVHDGPGFDHPVRFERGDVVEKAVGEATLHYCELVPLGD
jgi:uncharacterized protein (TIGR00290 family)